MAYTGNCSLPTNNEPMTPEISIVIPTFNRAERLRTCLDALTKQTQPASDFEVIVVDDGSSDGTAEMLDQMTTPFALRVVRQENRGYGAARNSGCEIAVSPYLLFLDDDIIASPELVAEHLRLQQEHDGAVISGAYPHLVSANAGRLTRIRAELRSESFRKLEERVPTFRSCTSANLSLPRSLFWQAGGFDADLLRGVDIELGYRLHALGATFVFAPTAVGLEDDRETSREWMADMELRGAVSLELWRRHPLFIASDELGGMEALGHRWLGLQRLLLALRAPPRLLNVFSNVLPGAWLRSWCTFLRSYCFWRGVRRAVPDDDTWRRLARGTPILMYHAVGGRGEPPSLYVVPGRRFERQMRWLRRRGYRVIALDELVSCRLEGRLPPAKSIVVTFDDGYADNLAVAAPVLAQHGFPATIFLVSEAGSRVCWNADPDVSGRPLITPSEARELSNGLVGFGAHSRTHPDLTSLTLAEGGVEVAGSRRDLEEALGATVTTFAYPYGRWNPEIRELVRRAGYLAACTVNAGRNRPSIDPYELRRLEVRGTDSMLRFIMTVWLGDTRSLLRLR